MNPYEIDVLPVEDHILERTSMYIGQPSLYGFQCFLSGLRIGNTTLLYWIDLDFDKWVLDHFAEGDKEESERKAHDLAMIKCNEDDAAAFHLYIEWIKQYKKSLAQKQ